MSTIATHIALMLALGIGKPEVIDIGDPFPFVVDAVRSIAPSQRIGFGHSLPVYAVDGASGSNKYTLYCLHGAPQSGKTYQSKEAYVSQQFSPFHLWPTDRKTLTFTQKGDKTLFFTVILIDVNSTSHPDEVCDVYSKKSQ